MADYVGLLNEIEAAVEEHWPEAAANLIYLTYDRPSLEKKIEAGHLPFVVVDIDLDPDEEQGNRAEAGPVWLHYVQKQDFDFPALVARLQAMQDHFTGRTGAWGRMEWLPAIKPNPKTPLAQAAFEYAWPVIVPAVRLDVVI